MPKPNSNTIASGDFPEYKTVPTADLIPYARNSRTHSDAQVAQIAASIREFGFLNPIIVDGDKGIIAGHGRVLAAQKLGLDKLPCIEASHLTDTQRRAYIIADNKLALNAGWDDTLLRFEFDELRDDGFNLELTGFSLDEIDALKPDPEPEKIDGEDDLPEVDPKYTSIKGDVWIIGNHRLMCGDCRDHADVDILMGEKKADLVWTDPPYNVDIEGAAGKIENDSMDDASFYQFLLESYQSYLRVMNKGAVIYVAHADSERANFTRAFCAAGFKFSQNLVWVKQSGTLSRQDFNWKHEPILYGWKEGAGHYFCGDFKLTTIIDDDVDIKKLSKDELLNIVKEIQKAQPSTAVRDDRPTSSPLHPTMKPVSLVERMIRWSSKPDWLVLDFFGGSGTTMVAAEKTGRSCYLMEIDPRFCDVIIERLKNLFGYTATLESTGETYDELKRIRVGDHLSNEGKS